MVADAGSFNPYGQPPQGGFGGPPPGPAAGGPPAAGGYGGPPAGGGYGAPDPGAGGGYGAPPPGGGGYGAPPPGGGFGGPPPGGPPAGGGYGGPPAGGGYGAPAGGGYGAPAAAPGGYGAPGGFGAPGGSAPMVATGGRGPVGTIRNPIMVIVVGSICFIYAIIQMWGMLNELKNFRGKDDINPIMLFVPILNIIMLWGLPAKVLEAKQMAGVPNASVPHPILYLLLGAYFLPADLNEVWQAAGGGQR